MIRSSFLAGTRMETYDGFSNPPVAARNVGMTLKFTIVLARAMTQRTRTIVKKVFVRRV